MFRKYLLGEVDFWGQTVDLYEKSLKTGTYLYLLCASWGISASESTNL